ncbi:DUF6452 family protein [Psychroserpens damuponensis]|uniref:DUF6452 family protein n=1 Tax=Psychroserpens damuponensis TaxID=943936 RepID=UPI00058C527F|nr:DUF6452 family protein [Psychroserpens damuponensis]
MKNIKFIILFIAIIFYSCERDDICSEATPTTPHLIIRFYDINNPDNLKQVRQLEIVGLDDTDTPLSENILSRTETDSIVLPLNFQAENEITTTRFQLEKDADFSIDVNEDGEDDLTTTSNPDVITITYTPEFVYVSRACGYKSIFHLDETQGIQRDGTAQGDDDTWITNFEIINETIENENAAQIIIYH